MAETTVYLSLGSNLGDREKNLRTAIAALADSKVRVTRVSSLYETEPVDLREQPWFLNCAVQGETESPPLDLLRALRGIRLVGCDVVEVAPPYDGPGQPTALAGANIALELLALRALARRG